MTAETETPPVEVFGGPSPKVRRIGADRPWTWLSAGWRDLRAAPQVGFAYGIVFAIAGAAIAYAAFTLDAVYLVLPFVVGFMLVGPIAAVGLYEASRLIAEGKKPTLGGVLFAWRDVDRANQTGQIALMGFALGFALFVWLRIAMLLFALFFGYGTDFDLERLVTTTLLTGEGAMFLLVGTAVGAVLAALVFSISVVSIPMLLDVKNANVVTAIATSVTAVRHNVVPMALWAGLIVVFTGAGLLTAFIGLAVTLPLIGHASWHAYRDLVDTGRE